MIVDAHTHLLPERLARRIRHWFEEHLTRDPFPYPWEPAPARAAIEAAGVGRCWSLPYVHRPQMASALNRAMAELFAGDPFVVPGATVHPEDDVARVIDEALGELRLRLVKLHCAVGAHEPDDPRLDPLWRRVSDEGQPVVVHAGHSDRGSTQGAELQPIDRVASRFPAARIVIAHCGGPSCGQALEIVRRHRSVFADLTPVVTEPLPLTADDLRGVTDRILFGSDAPNTLVTIEQNVAFVRAVGLAAADVEAILGGNAERLVPSR